MKYAAVLGLAFRQQLSSRADLIARLLLYVVLMIVFSRLWVAVGEEGTATVGVGPLELFWYFALTEIVAVGTPLLFLSIEEDVRRGDIAYRVGRPISYLGAKLAEGVGELLVRFTCLATLGLGAAWLLGGGLPGDPRGLLLALPLLLLGAGVMVVVQAGVGLSALWLQEATPLSWLMQKAMFVFGGLLFPIEIYPAWLETAAQWTPFSAIMHAPARLVFAYDPALAACTLVRIVAWGAVILGAVVLLYRRGLRDLSVNGG